MVFAGWTSLSLGWNSDDPSAAETAFVMPDTAVTVTACFTGEYPAGATFYVDSEGRRRQQRGHQRRRALEDPGQGQRPHPQAGRPGAAEGGLGL